MFFLSLMTMQNVRSTEVLKILKVVQRPNATTLLTTFDWKLLQHAEDSVIVELFFMITLRFSYSTKVLTPNLRIFRIFWTFFSKYEFHFPLCFIIIKIMADLYQFNWRFPLYTLYLGLLLLLHNIYLSAPILVWRILIQ